MLGACTAVLALFERHRQGRDFSDRALLAHMPEQEGATVFLNIGALRQSGLLDAIAGKRDEEEPEYQAFVRETGFNYRDDLDAVLAHFAIDFNIFILRGRFSWQQIGGHMRANGGQCLNGVCWMQVARGRYVSALPLSANVVAIGTGGHRNVVYSALPLRTNAIPTLPSEPLWAELSEDFLKNPSRLPDGTRSFVTALQGARSVFLSAGPSQGGLQAHLRAAFATPKEALERKEMLEQATALLQKFFDRDRQKPSESQLATMLTAGKFEQNQDLLLGHWPLERTFFEHVVSGN